MAMKGMAVLMLATFLILIMAMTVPFIISSIFDAHPDNPEVLLDNVVYVMRDSLDIAKLYVENSARYSLVQAMYDNGRNGGFAEGSAQVAAIGGVEYPLWYDGSDLSPGASLVSDSLEDATGKNFLEYVKGRRVHAIFPITLPLYQGAKIENKGDYVVGLGIPADTSLLITRKNSAGDELTIEKDSGVSVEVAAPYYRMFSLAKREHEELMKKLGGCKAAEIEKTTDEDCCTLTVSLASSSPECVAKVEISSKGRFLVWNGTEAGPQPLTFRFADRQRMQE